VPRNGAHTPTSMRASDDLPEAVGPMMPSAFPPVSVKFTSWQTIFCSPGGVTAAFCTTTDFEGGCNGIGSLRGASWPSNRDSRCQLCRAPMKPRQLAIARSTGASARPPKIEPAMMMPGVDSWWITSQAPTASSEDCNNSRSTFEAAPRPPTTSLAWPVATM
jgi:hypothetical protein